MSDSNELVIKVTGGSEFSDVLDRLTNGLEALHTAMSTAAIGVNHFGAAISEVKASKLTAVTQSVTKLIKAVNKMPTGNSLSKKAQGLEELGVSIAKVNAAAGDTDKLDNMISSMLKLTNVIKALPSTPPSLSMMVRFLDQVGTLSEVDLTKLTDLDKVIEYIGYMSDGMSGIKIEEEVAKNLQKFSVGVTNMIDALKTLSSDDYAIDEAKIKKVNKIVGIIANIVNQFGGIRNIGQLGGLAKLGEAFKSLHLVIGIISNTELEKIDLGRTMRNLAYFTGFATVLGFTFRQFDRIKKPENLLLITQAIGPMMDMVETIQRGVPSMEVLKNMVKNLLIFGGVATALSFIFKQFDRIKKPENIGVIGQLVGVLVGEKTFENLAKLAVGIHTIKIGSLLIDLGKLALLGRALSFALAGFNNLRDPRNLIGVARTLSSTAALITALGRLKEPLAAVGPIQGLMSNLGLAGYFVSNGLKAFFTDLAKGMRAFDRLPQGTVRKIEVVAAMLRSLMRMIEAIQKGFTAQIKPGEMASFQIERSLFSVFESLNDAMPMLIKALSHFNKIDRNKLKNIDVIATMLGKMIQLARLIADMDQTLNMETKMRDVGKGFAALADALSTMKDVKIPANIDKLIAILPHLDKLEEYASKQRGGGGGGTLNKLFSGYTGAFGILTGVVMGTLQGIRELWHVPGEVWKIMRAVVDVIQLATLGVGYILVRPFAQLLTTAAILIMRFGIVIAKGFILYITRAAQAARFVFTNLIKFSGLILGAGLVYALSKWKKLRIAVIALTVLIGPLIWTTVNLINRLKDAAGILFNLFRKAWTALAPLREKIAQLVPFIKRVFGAIPGIVRAAFGLLGSIARTAVGAIGTAFKTLGTVVGAVFKTVFAVGGVVGRLLVAAGKKLGSLFVKTFQTAMKTIKFGADMWNGLVRSAQSAADRIGGIFRSLSSNMRNVAQTASQIGTQMLNSPLSLNRLARSSQVTEVIDFDQVVKQIEVLGGVAADQLPVVNEFLLKLGADTSFSASESAAAFLELSRSGLSAADSMAALPSMLSLAAVGNIEVADSAALVINAVAAYGKTFADSEEVVNSFAAAANVSTAEVADLATGFSYAAPTAAAFGTDMNTLNAALALLSDRGLDASKAGTGLRAVFSQFMAPTKSAIDAMADLGLSFYDSSGNAREFMDIIGDINQVLTEGTAATNYQPFSEESRNAILDAIGGSANATTALLSLMGTQEDGTLTLEKYTEAMARSATAAEIGAALMDTVRGSLTKLKSSFQVLIIKALQPLLNNILKPLLDLLTQAINAISSLPGPVLATAAALFGIIPLVTTLTGAGLVLLSWTLTPLFIMFGALATTTLALAHPLALLATIFGTGIGIATALTLGLALVPVIGAIAGAFITLRNALQSELLSQQMDRLRAAIGSVKEAFQGMGEAVRTVLSGLQYTLFGSEGGTNLKNIFAARRAVNHLADAVQAFADKAKNVKEGMQAFAMFFDMLRVHRGDAGSTVGEIQERWAKLTKFMQQNPLFKARLGENFTQRDVVDYFRIFDESMQRVQAAFGNVAAVIGNFIADIINPDVSLADAFRKLFNDGAAAVAQVAGTLLQTIEHVFGVDISDTLVNNLVSGNMRALMEGFGRQMLEWIVMGTIKSFGMLVTLGASITDVLFGWDIADEVESIFNRLVRIFQAGVTLIMTLVDKFLPGFDNIGSTVEGVLDVVDDALSRVEKFMFDLNAVIGGNMLVGDSIFGDLLSLDPDTGEQFFDLSNAIQKLMDDLAQMGSATVLPFVRDQLSSLGDTLKSIDWLGIGTEMGQAFLVLMNASQEATTALVSDLLGRFANIDWTKVGADMKAGALAAFSFLAGMLDVSLDNIINFVQDVDWQAVWDSLVAGFNAFLSTVTAVADLALSKVVKVVDDVANFFSVPENVTKFQEGLTKAVTGVWDAMGDIPIALLDHLIPGFDAEKAKEAWSGIGDSIASTLNDVLGGAFSALFGEEGNGSEVFRTKLDDIKTSITGMLQSLWAAIEPFAAALGENLGMVWESIKDAFASLGDLDLSPLVEFFKDEKTVAAIEGGLAAIGGFFYLIAQAGLGVIKGLADAVPAIVDLINALLQKDWDGVAYAIGDVFKNFVNGFLDVIKNIPGFDAAVSAVKSIFFSVIADLLGALASFIETMGTEIDFGLGNVNKFSGTAKTWVKDLNEVKNAYQDLADQTLVTAGEQWENIWPDPEPAAAAFRTFFEEWNDNAQWMEGDPAVWIKDWAMQINALADNMGDARFTENAAAMEDFKAAVEAMGTIPLDQLLIGFTPEQLAQFEALAQVDIPGIGLTPEELNLNVDETTKVNVPDGLADDLAPTLGKPLTVQADVAVTTGNVVSNAEAMATKAQDFADTVEVLSDNTELMTTTVETDWAAVATAVTTNVPTIVEYVGQVTAAWSALTDAVVENHNTTLTLVPITMTTVVEAMTQMVTATDNQSNALTRLSQTTATVQEQMLATMTLMANGFVLRMNMMRQSVMGLVASLGQASATLAGSGLATFTPATVGGVAGQRAAGGPVREGRLYEVAEQGVSELLKLGGKTFLIPGQDGTVVPPSGATAGGLTPGAPTAGQLGMANGAVNDLLDMNDPETANLEVNRHNEAMLANIDKNVGAILAWLQKDMLAYFDTKFEELSTKLSEAISQISQASAAAASEAATSDGGGAAVSNGSAVSQTVTSGNTTTTRSTTLYDADGNPVSSGGQVDIYQAGYKGKTGTNSWDFLDDVLGRANGGSTTAGLYKVMERGVPELYESNGDTYFMSPDKGAIAPITPGAPSAGALGMASGAVNDLVDMNDPEVANLEVNRHLEAMVANIDKNLGKFLEMFTNTADALFEKWEMLWEKLDALGQSISAAATASAGAAGDGGSGGSGGSASAGSTAAAAAAATSSAARTTGTYDADGNPVSSGGRVDIYQAGYQGKTGTNSWDFLDDVLGRETGGSTTAGLYKVMENGQPELYESNGETYFMSPQAGAISALDSLSPSTPAAGALGMANGAVNDLLDMNDPAVANLEVNRHLEAMVANIDKNLGKFLEMYTNTADATFEKWELLFEKLETLGQSISAGMTDGAGAGGDGGSGGSGGSASGSAVSNATGTGVNVLKKAVGVVNTATNTVANILSALFHAKDGPVDIYQAGYNADRADSDGTVSGGRYFGGRTERRKAYHVNETGKPELYREGTNNYLLTGNQPGRVSPLDHLMRSSLRPADPVANGGRNGYNQYVTYDVNVTEGDININAPGAGPAQVAAIRRSVAQQQAENRERISTVLKRHGRQ